MPAQEGNPVRVLTTFRSLVGGSPLILIDLISADANLGFTPTYASTKRSAISAATLGDDLEARRLSTSQTSPNAIGNLILTYLQFLQGKNKGSNPANTFQKVPILGNLYYSDYNPRK